jgi:hypothetical protein
LKDSGDAAQDSEGDIAMVDGEAQSIASEYADELIKVQPDGNLPVPWWSSQFNEYDFSSPNAGGAFCSSSTKNMGITGDLKNGRGVTITVCPGSFTSSSMVATLGASEVVKGDDLWYHQPRSTTLFHEAMHAVMGGAFLSSKEETCKLIRKHIDLEFLS